MIKRATCNTWAEYFENREGVRIAHGTIRYKLVEAGKIGETARNRVGRVLCRAYFSESDVREACADLLRPMPQADEAGFFVRDGVRYATKSVWARELGISNRSVNSGLRSFSVGSLVGRNSIGNLREFLPEPAIRAACANFMRGLPQADGSNFFVLDDILHGTIKAIAQLHKVSNISISSRLASSGLAPVQGCTKLGRIRDFYPEPSVRRMLKDFLDLDIPRCGPDGFADIHGIRYGTIASLSRFLGLSEPTVSARLVQSGFAPINGKDKMGHQVELFPEPATRDLLADLLDTALHSCESDGFINISGISYGTIGFLARFLGILSQQVYRRIISSGIGAVHGKDRGGRITNFYPEPAVRELCKDLLERKKK